ncbi:MAG: hypothetical protein K1W38_04920 [Lachnospiraceae bacterium]
MYKGTLIPLPAPKYIVFYNGTDHQPDCRRLHDYSLFIATVRQNLERGYAIKQAIRAAIKQCIHDHVLEDILLKQESEVYHMLLNEFDIERYGRTKREEGSEEEQKRMVMIINNYKKTIAEKEAALAEKDNALTLKEHALAQQRTEIERLHEENRKLKEAQQK